jgi:hypothetical protein
MPYIQWEYNIDDPDTGDWALQVLDSGEVVMLCSGDELRVPADVVRRMFEAYESLRRTRACLFCGKGYADHRDKPNPFGQPRVPCLLLKAHYLPRPKPPPGKK